MSEQPGRPLFASRKRTGDQPPLVRIDPHTLGYFTVILILLGLAGWLYLHQASQVATYAHQIRRLEHDKERLHREMIALRAQVAEAGALTRLLEQAPEGYSLPQVSESDRMLIIEVPIEANNMEALPTKPVTPTHSEITTRPLPGRLMDQLGAWLSAPPK